MREIKLTKGYVAIVDDEDFEWLSQFKWCASVEGRGGAKVYAIRMAKKHERINGRSYKIRMHREVLRLPPWLFSNCKVVDHTDGDSLNNQKSNLKALSQEENMANSNFGYFGKSICEPSL